MRPSWMLRRRRGGPSRCSIMLIEPAVLCPPPELPRQLPPPMHRQAETRASLREDAAALEWLCGRQVQATQQRAALRSRPALPVYVVSLT